MPELKLIALGGAGRVTQNMYLYEYEKELLIVDCGIGFPDAYMPGVDVLIPDFSYLLRRLEDGAKIVGMILSHGHDDHIAATPYILPLLPDFPIFASELTAGFAEQRMADVKVDRPITVISDDKEFQLGNYFSAKLVPVTHSVPDTRHIILSTPEGVIYHGSDFKLDPTPVDQIKTDLETIGQLGQQQVLCAMLDCLRVENSQQVGSESAVGPVIESQMSTTKGKFVITLMSSHIHRIQQIVDAAEKLHRKVVFIGRSVEQNVEVATRLGKLILPDRIQVDKRQVENFRDSELCLIVAGSQGQEGSTLVRAIFGEHRILQIKDTDKVVFSADAIPGNELPYFGAIDELCRNNIDVVYPEILPGLHQSGHASAPEQQQILSLIKPRYVMPIGGADRHRRLFLHRVAEPEGYNQKTTLLPQTGEVLGFSGGQVRIVEKVVLKPQLVDGLGIGDVGPVVLSDRQTLGQAGMVVVVLPRSKDQLKLHEIKVISRGFVFMKEAGDVVDYIKTTVKDVITKSDLKPTKKNDAQLSKRIEKKLSRKLFEVIRREPMIVPIFIDLD